MKIEDSARGGDDHLAALAQLPLLGPNVDATVDAKAADVLTLAQLGDLAGNLCRQFSSGDHDQGAGQFLAASIVSGVCPSRVGVQASENWQGKRRRFAGPGLSLSNQIPTLDGQRHQTGLDWGRGFVTGRSNRF